MVVAIMVAMQEPALREVLIMLKYGPWRQKLRKICQAELQAQKSSGESHKKHRVSSSGCQARADALLHMLQRLAQQMDGEISEAWVSNIGHNIGFCTGPVPFLTQLGIIGAAKAGSHGMVFGKDINRRKQLRKTPTEMARARGKLAHIVRTSDALSKLTAPRTCKEWIALYWRAVAIIKSGGRSQVVRLSGNAYTACRAEHT